MPTTIVGYEILSKMMTNTGESIWDLSNRSPVFLVFLRHFGCVFCKEALADLSEKQKSMQQKNIQLVFAHMGTPQIAEQYFSEFKIQNPLHVTDPDREFYYEFGLRKGTFSQLYGLRTWMRGFSTETSNYKLELAKHLGDSTQMPGIFLLQNGEVVEEYIHKHASDRPDYNALIACCNVPS